MDFTNLLFFLLSYMFISSGLTATAQKCYDTGNFTANSTFGRNRNLILSSLASNVNDGFYDATIGEDPDMVYALALCRGDSSSEDCFNCVNVTSQEIISKCPNQKEAFLWRAFRDMACMVRYSDSTFLGILEVDPKETVFNTRNITSVLTEFNQIWEKLMVGLVRKASMGTSRLKFATEEANLTTFQTIYAVMQCTPDLSESNCEICLRQYVAEYQNCCYGKQGGVVQGPDCMFRWELYPFYNSTVDAPPPPPPSPPPLATSTIPQDNGGDMDSRTVVIISVSIIIYPVVLVLAYVVLRKWKAKQERNYMDEIDTTESLQFDFSTIKAATNDFLAENKLGQGGFGVVYKGRLPNGQHIAVKRLSTSSGQGDVEFKNEVLLVAWLQHRNLVRLLGFCLEGNERLLIYEFVPNSSLDNFIFDPIKRGLLNWETRYKIIGGIARGILYLHEDSRLRIVHRDLKASNILLDLDMNPKISDFGMARLFEIDQTQGDTSRIVGTFGYMAWKNWKEGTALNVMDPTLRGGSPSEIMRCIHIGLLCVQENVASRPTMASVVLMLTSSSVSLPVPAKPAFFMHSRAELNNSEIIVSDQSRNRSVQFSSNDVSITE